MKPIRVLALLPLVLSLTLAACSGSDSTSDRATNGASPPVAASSLRNEIGPDAVWDALAEPSSQAGSGVVQQLHECGQPDQVSCAERIMEENGASNQAIAFYKSTGWFMTDYESFGRLALATLVQPWRANANNQYVVLNGDPKLVYVEEQGSRISIEADPAYPALAAAFPAPPDTPAGQENIMAFPADNLFERVEEGADGGTRFIFQYRVVNVCHACGTGYNERVALDFDANGMYSNVHLLGLCRTSAAETRIPDVPECPPTP